MKYDPLELIKLNITEADIQKQRDFVLKLLTETSTSSVVTIIESFWLPFIIDMFEDYEITIKPHSFERFVEIKVNLNP